MSNQQYKAVSAEVAPSAEGADSEVGLPLSARVLSAQRAWRLACDDTGFTAGRCKRAVRLNEPGKV